MLKAITWSDYFTAVAILAALWYGIILLIYFRKETVNLIKGKYKFPVPGRQTKEENIDEEEDDESSEHSFEELEGIVTDIRHSILEEAGENTSKEALLQALKERLENYGGLRQPAFRVALNNFIIQYSESICGVAFSEGELNAAWETLPP